MCGITGILLERASAGDGLQTCISDMATALSHRGPDDSGVWTDDAAGVALGHRRLSIIDPSPVGHQPMASHSGRYVISYNGEIYNFTELRAELSVSGMRFTGGSDTEVILASIERWGIAPALERFIGMFAFAVWDREDRELTLVRDRLGIKPLYYGWVDGGVVFGSELKSLCRYPGFARDVAPDAAATMLQYGYIPAPHTIFRDTYKLLPGHLLTLRAGNMRAAESRPFWSASDGYDPARNPPFDGDDEAAVTALDDLLGDAVSRRMIADVPLGALLSGGLDSSTVVAAMQARSGRPVKTFSVGFEDREHDESRFAREISHRLGTDHTEYELAPKDALDAVPDLAAIYDEPFGDSSQIPTLLISRIARRDVTVVLSGDGGDEVFGGYRRYGHAETAWGIAGRLPQMLRRAGAAAMAGPSEKTWDGVFRLCGPALPSKFRKSDLGSRLHALAAALEADNGHEFYHRMMSLWPDAQSAVPGAVLPATRLSDPSAMPAIGGMAERAMYTDLMTYLPDDILTKVDRASMSVGLELRVPLLDHRIVEFAARLPHRMKRRGGQSKWILRKVCEKYLPAGLFDRPKTGFSIPLADWLRGPLRPWAEELLSEQRLLDTGILDPATVRAKWNDHVSGKGNRAPALWNALMLQQWLTEMGRPGVSR